MQQLTYKYTKQFNCSYPPFWDDSKSADLDLIYGYRKGNHNISLSKPENTSVGRSFPFYKGALETFFNNLVVAIFNFVVDLIINFNESGITTVLNTQKIFA